MESRSGQYMTFKLNDNLFALQIAEVHEIVQVPAITKVPNAAKGVLGVVNLRGSVIGVLDLKVRMGMGKTEISKKTCVIIINSKSGRIGILVDEIGDALSINRDQIESPGEAIGEGDLVHGIAKNDEGVTIILDLSNPFHKGN